MVVSKQRWIKAAAAAVVFVVVGEIVGIFPQPKSLETLENSYIDSGRQTAAVVVHPKRDAGDLADKQDMGDVHDVSHLEEKLHEQSHVVPHDEEGQHPEVDESVHEPAKKKIAVVVTVTQEAKDQATRHQMIDGAAVLAESLLRTDSKYHFEFIAIVYSGDRDTFLHVSKHPEIQASRKPLQEIGYLIVEKETPVTLPAETPETKFFRENVQKAGCCGLREMLKMEAFLFTQYHKVMLLDIDAFVVQNVDELFEEDTPILYTEDIPMDPRHHNAKPPMQGGFFIIKPGPETEKAYNDIVAIMEKGNFKSGVGWEGSNIGYHWGGAAVQGVFAYYFNIRAPKEWSRAVDRCIYNFMGPDDKKAMIPSEVNNCTVDEIKTVHFTICQKPWSCHLKHEYPCKELQDKWWDVRFMIEDRMVGHEVKRDPCTDQSFPYRPLGIAT